MRIITYLGILLSSFLPTTGQNIQLRSLLTYENDLSNIWGYHDSAGNEYALVGWYRGVSIVDVTNPDTIRELIRIPAAGSNWREIKTWNRHLYATNETGGGLLIADLSSLPDSASYVYWQGDSALNTAHTLFIDENGFLYLFGYNDINRSIPFERRGALICDLNTDPQNPVIVGNYSAQYIHDGYVRGDTLWAAEIQNGGFSVIDVSTKSEPFIMAFQETPNKFAHNCWLSDDGNYLFTTDERSNAFITAYDVSDIGNISEIDRYQADPGSQLIPHNTHFINNFLVSSYYKYGVNIIDVTQPGNLVEVGHYDTSPFPNGDGFSGCWGVYPYLPSGTILASDIETGLYVLTPDYKRACYLTGNVVNDSTGAAVHNATVEILATSVSESTDLLGNYSTGLVQPGIYDVRFYKDGCLPKIFVGVELESAVTDTLNVVMTCTTFVGIHTIDLFSLQMNALPSLFEGQTLIQYRMPPGETGILQIFDHNGRLMSSVVLSDAEGEIITGMTLPKGIYLVRLQAATFSRTMRVGKLG